MTAGHFSSPNVVDIAAGAPQHSGSGKVGTSSFLLISSRRNEVLIVVGCCSDICFLFFSDTGLHFQDRWWVSGEEFSGLRENGTSSDVVRLVSVFNQYAAHILL